MVVTFFSVNRFKIQVHIFGGFKMTFDVSTWQFLGHIYNIGQHVKVLQNAANSVCSLFTEI